MLILVLCEGCLRMPHPDECCRVVVCLSGSVHVDRSLIFMSVNVTQKQMEEL